jgi:hypothetical protein
MLNSAYRVPEAAGVNTTVTLQLAPGWTVEGCQPGPQSGPAGDEETE